MAERPLQIKYKGKNIRAGTLGDAIKELPRYVRGKALKAAADYLVKKFKLYPPYKYVKRAKAYPEVNGFFSDKQRRFVMAAIADGRIQPGSPHRTMATKNAWHVDAKQGELARLSVINDAPQAVFLYDPTFQARQVGLVGWKNIDDMLAENEADAILEVELYIYNNFPKIFDELIKKG